MLWPLYLIPLFDLIFTQFSAVCVFALSSICTFNRSTVDASEPVPGTPYSGCNLQVVHIGCCRIGEVNVTNPSVSVPHRSGAADQKTDSVHAAVRLSDRCTHAVPDIRHI